MKNKDLKFNTRLVHGGSVDDPFGSASVPIYQSSTFAFKNAEHGGACFAGKEDGYIYTRIGNPTIGISDLEACASSLAREYGLLIVVDNTCPSRD